MTRPTTEPRSLRSPLLPGLEIRLVEIFEN